MYVEISLDQYRVIRIRVWNYITEYYLKKIEMYLQFITGLKFLPPKLEKRIWKQ